MFAVVLAVPGLFDRINDWRCRGYDSRAQLRWLGTYALAVLMCAPGPEPGSC